MAGWLKHFEQVQLDLVVVVTQGRKRADRWVAQTNLPFPLLVDESFDIARAYGVYRGFSKDSAPEATPSVFLVDRSGVIQFSQLLHGEGDLKLSRLLDLVEGGQREAAKVAGKNLPRVGESMIMPNSRVFTVTERVVVDSEPEVLWELLCNRPSWDSSVTQQIWHAEPAAGSHVELHEKTRFGSASCIEEVVVWSPPERLVQRRARIYTSIREVEIELRLADGGAQVEVLFDSRTFLFGLARPLARLWQRAEHRRLTRLARDLARAARK